MNSENVNLNLLQLIEILSSDKDLAQKFSEYKNIDELYKFSLSIKSGYTKEELSEILNLIGELGVNEKLDDEKLDSVAGGINLGRKIASGALGLLTLASVGGISPNKTYAADYGNSSIIQKQEKSENNINKKNKMKKILKYVLIGAGAAAVVGTGIYFLNKKEKGGLINVGNSCYLNSTLQQLYSIKAFREKVMSDDSKDEKVTALREIFTHMDSGKALSYEEMDPLVRKLGYDDEQKDAGEFLTSTLNGIFNKYGLSSMVSDPLPCEEGANFKHGMQYLLDYHTFDITRLNSEFGGGFDGNAADAGDVLSKACVDGALGVSPGEYYSLKPIGGQFMACLNRTGFDRATGQPFKNTSKVEIGSSVERDGKTYNLTGVICHMGEESGSGHYISYKLDSDGQWRLYNDDRVTVVKEADVLEKASTGGTIFTYSEAH